MDPKDIPYNSELKRRADEQARKYREAQERQEEANREPVKINLASLKWDDLGFAIAIFALYAVVFMRNFGVETGFYISAAMAVFPFIIARGRPSRFLLWIIAGVGLFGMFSVFFR